jgi:hypothetical protein
MSAIPNEYVIKKGSLFLMGCPYDDSAYIRYTENKYDGYRDRSFNRQLRIARAVGGKVMRFNYLTGQLEGGWK